MDDIMKEIESLEESGLLIKNVSESIKNEEKWLKGAFFGIVLGALSVS